MSKETKTPADQKDLAERCRIALEKSYGTQLPMPKCFAKKNHEF